MASSLTDKELARWIASEAGNDNPTIIAVEVWAAAIRRWADAAIADAVQMEREACAAACLSLDHGEPLRGEEAAFVHGSVLMRAKCAAAIRNRKEQPDVRKPDGGPAFPFHVPESEIKPGVWSNPVNNFGISLRDYFAAQAMKRYSGPSDMRYSQVAAWSYEMADAMLAERNKPDEQ